MNKQELINKLKKLLTTPSELEGYDFDDGYDLAIESAIALAEDLDDHVISPEMEKPVVLKYVADWIEWCKNNNVTLLGAISPIDELGTAICNDKEVESLDASKWATQNQETFAKAWLFGYEVEKEKLYTVEIPIANSPLGYHYVLRKTTSGEIIIDSFFTNNWGNYDYCQLTEEEIKKEHDWAWKYAKEVNNNDD